ncbi:hypothetical protein [Streptomyces spiramyceticus]|uniref:hypothetical protein n=1 Tax=Streptomyces spiramyceticus TaxID=299717 RepID=UPI00237BFCBE|nr:hypothetical protein [Streptomyces spiramyceticus]
MNVPGRSQRRIEADRRADWRQIEGLYRQMTSLLDEASPEKPMGELPDIIAGPLALRFGRVFAAYAGKEDTFGEDLLTVMSEVDSLTGDDIDRFRKLYLDTRCDQHAPYRRDNTKRRRPRPFEAAIETSRRLRDLNDFRRITAQAGVATAGIVGGSASYGRFYNVKGRPQPKSQSSDLDLLLIVPTFKEVPKLCEALLNMPAMDSDAVTLLRDRSTVHESLTATYGNHVLLSQKIPMWHKHSDPFLGQRGFESEYDLSLHIASLDTFNEIILAEIPRIRDGMLVSIHDYRADEPTRAYFVRGFNGLDVPADQEYTPASTGFVSHVRICDSAEGRFKPGLHQNLIMPQFEVRWDDQPLSLRLPVIYFRWKVLERLREERAERPHEVQLLSLSHMRYGIFAPHIRSRVDNYSIES